MSAAVATQDRKPFHTALFSNLGALIVSGLIGLVLWELYIRFGAPILSGKFPLNGPVGLAQTVLNKTLGLNELVGRANARQIAEVLHYFTAFIGYPLGYLLVARPVARAVNGIVPIAPFWLTGLAYGFALFIFAGYVMGHLIAGFPPLFGLNLERIAPNPALFGAEGAATPLLKGAGVPLGSMVGHMLLGLGIASGARLLLGR